MYCPPPTCEDGNVLLKEFEHDPSDIACLFSCAPGYERVALEHGDDCVLLENSGLYWHLVDVIWIFLLPLFYLAA